METNQPMQPLTPAPDEVPMSTSAKRVSLQTLLLIFGLGALTIFFLVLALMPQKQTPVARIQPTPTPNPAQSVLTLTETNPTGTQAASLTTKAFDIHIQTGTNKVTAVQVTLAFDPSSVNAITITPGGFFQQPTELIKTVDYSGGRIVYAVAIQPTASGVRGEGKIATVTYHVLPTAISPIQFSFLPKTLVTAEGITPSVLKTSTGIQVIIPTSTSQAVPVGSPSSQILR